MAIICPKCGCNDAEIALVEERKRMRVIDKIVDEQPTFNSKPLIDFDDVENSHIESYLVCLECHEEFLYEDVLFVNSNT